MAFTAHLLVDGVKGESEHEGYAEHIDVMSYAMSVNNTPSWAGGGWSSGHASASEFSFMLNEGASSTKLEELVANGATVGKVTLKLSKSTGGDKLEEYKTVEFIDCKITLFSEAASSEVPMNNVSIAYGTKKVNYKGQATAGGQLTNAANYGWDFKKNAKAA
jgi:type VI protein secretion system component Hcp